MTRTSGSDPRIAGGKVDVPRGEPLERELEDFVRAVAGGGAPRVGGADGRRALALAQRVADAMRDERASRRQEAGLSAVALAKAGDRRQEGT